MPRPTTKFSEEIQTAAAAWLARRDRGLDPNEQDRYLEWLYADPQHGLAISHLERAWRALDQLEKWRPAHSTMPNPDLLTPRCSHRRRAWALGCAMAASLAILLGVNLLPRPGPTVTSDPVAGLTPTVAGKEPEVLRRHVLPDGSTLDLSEDAVVDIAYATEERRVRLVKGEVFFTVAREENRPFVVEASGVSVQALGTAFTVALGKIDVSVFVTEGAVEVRDENHPTSAGPTSDPIILTAGQRAVLRYHRLIPYDELPRYREEQKRAAEPFSGRQEVSEPQS